MSLVAAQPTVIGREIHHLDAAPTGVLVPSGDYGANTGPIHGVVVDPVTLTVTDAATLGTEETWAARPTLDGGLIIPHIDPRGGMTSTAHYSLVDAAGGWMVDQSVSPVPEHVMDAAHTADGWWLFGSSYGSNPAIGGAATIWRSIDNRVTWTTPVLLDDPGSDTGYARFYLAVPIGGEIIAVLGDMGGNRQFRWNGSTLAEESAPDVLLTDFVAFSYSGTPFALAWPSGKQTGAVTAGPWRVLTASADAGQAATIAATLPAVSVLAAAVGSSLYLLDDELYLHRGHTDGTWARVASLGGLGLTNPTTVRSMLVDETNGFLFFGTTDSRVVRVPIPA